MRAELPAGKAPTTRFRRRTSLPQDPFKGIVERGYLEAAF